MELNIEKFLNKLEVFLDNNKGMSSLIDKNYKLYIEKLKFIASSNEQLIQLHWYISQISSENNLSSVTTLTLNAFYEMLKPSACSLYLLKDNKKFSEINSINKKICKNAHSCDFIKQNINKAHKPLNFNSINCSNKKNFCAYNSFISYPLYKRDGNILGYLVAFYKEKNAILKSDIQLLMDIFCIQIGLSLENVMVEEKMITLAFTDELTGLYNKRMLLKRIKVEIERYNIHTENSSGIGCIMIDIDNFKHYNDSFGHIAGDFVIEHIGEVILSNISESDIGARYGGEEMCILLPNKTLDESINIAESIRKQIENTVFEFREITVSLGVGHYPTNIDNASSNLPADIIQYADTCLYHSKNTGKNKVTSSYNISKNYLL